MITKSPDALEMTGRRYLAGAMARHLVFLDMSLELVVHVNVK